MVTDPVAEAFFEVEAVDPPERVISPAGAARTFRHYDQYQSFLLPPSLDDWLPEDHIARFISEAVDEMLDLSVVYASYERSDGAPSYDPKMMLKHLLYAYSTGVTSSRRWSDAAGWTWPFDG